MHGDIRGIHLAYIVLITGIIYYYLSFGDHEDEWFEKTNQLTRKYASLNRNSFLSGYKFSTNNFDNHDVINRYKTERSKNVCNKINRKENAALLMLTRNWELSGALSSMRSLEDKFNKDYQYDWVFMNDVPFDQEFITATSAMASGRTFYHLIPDEDWNPPLNLNQTLYSKRLKVLAEAGVLYGGSASYRNMCRFYSGFFFNQSILDPYGYYLRVEPDVEFLCDFPYDPFRIMHQNNKKYGFVITLREYEETLPTLWENVQEYIDVDNGTTIDMSNNAHDFIMDDDLVGNESAMYVTNDNYNMCHFWSNFEIGDLNFFRSQAYGKFFNHLDSKHGFFHERWGDAPVHSIIASLLLRSDEIIHFDEIGYTHAPYSTCPTSQYTYLAQRCQCSVDAPGDIPLQSISCLTRWWKYGSGKKFMKEI